MADAMSSSDPAARKSAPLLASAVDRSPASRYFAPILTGDPPDAHETVEEANRMTTDTDQSDSPRGVGIWIPAAVILVVIAFVYWPIHQAWFVWDDKILIHDNAWLSRGGQSWTIVFHGIYDWRYFRPLGLALMIAEARCFGITPGPMHLVSLVLQLVDTAVVGALAWRLRPQGRDGLSAKLVCIAMLAYGLHPALIEPVAWIASQFDLLLTLFMILGLLLNLSLQRAIVRVSLVSLCFFLAACAKETAIAFPILLVLLDWARPDDSMGTSNPRDHAYAMIRRQWPIYLAVFATGMVYLILRNWAKSGHEVDTYWTPLLSWERFQTVCYTYMVYWRMIVWPFIGLSPHHIFADGHFAATGVASLVTDLAAVMVGATGVLLTWRHRKIGILIVGVSAIVSPVLHIIPFEFDDSLYHERYAASAVALVCALLPGIIVEIASFEPPSRFFSRVVMTLVTVWLLLAALTVRTTIPLWNNDTRMWQWAWRTNPDSVIIANDLLATYLTTGDLQDATPLANLLMVKGRSCASCMMNASGLALMEGDAQRATEALGLADKAFRYTPPDHYMVISYLIWNGDLHQLKHDDAGAADAYRDAISIDPLRPDGYLCLSRLLAREGKADDARKVFDKAVPIMAPDVIDQNRKNLEAAIAEGAKARPTHY
jgi:hypothetical protein